MILHKPFFIGSALAPALKIGDTTLTLLDVLYEGERDRAVFELRGPDIEYADNTLHSGYGCFKNPVETFLAFLAFLEVAVEAQGWDGSDNHDIFPPHVTAWAVEHADGICTTLCSLRDEDGRVRLDLIEE